MIWISLKDFLKNILLNFESDKTGRLPTDSNFGAKRFQVACYTVSHCCIKSSLSAGKKNGARIWRRFKNVRHQRIRLVCMNYCLTFAGCRLARKRETIARQRDTIGCVVLIGTLSNAAPALGIGAGTARTAAKVEPNRLLTAGHRNATGICRPCHLIQFQSTPLSL
jgi:hypothetical protein